MNGRRWDLGFHHRHDAENIALMPLLQSLPIPFARAYRSHHTFRSRQLSRLSQIVIGLD